MATIAYKIFEHHVKADGTVNVKIRVSHKGEKRYLDTEHFLGQKQLTDKFLIKDKFILKLVEDTVFDYRQEISKLKTKIDSFSAESLKDYLKESSGIDFIAFSRKHIAKEKKEKRYGSASNHLTIVNSLIDYFGTEKVTIQEVNSNMLYAYETYLKGERQLTRIIKGKLVTRTNKGLRKGGLHNHMRDLRTLFKEALKVYNNKDLEIIRIKHYPFETYKVGRAPVTAKRSYSIEEIKLIQQCKPEPNSRAELARDLFMLAFYMCGTNAVDFYNHLHSIKPNQKRWDFNRSKTCAIRDDNAFISICIIPEAMKLIEKYQGKLSLRYATHGGLDTALYMGMKVLRKLTGLTSMTLYWARHSFATIARNVCGLSKDDIGEALNHIDEEHTTTDIYLTKNWDIVDKVQHLVGRAYNAKYKVRKRKRSIEPIFIPIKVISIFDSIVCNKMIY